MKTKALAATLGFLLAAAGTAFAQDDINATRRNALIRAIEKAAPAVVSVNVVVEGRVAMMSGDFWDLFAPPRPIYRKVNTVGSGFIFDPQGYVITNYHVVEDAAKVASVTLPDGREIPVDVIGADKRSDLAVLKARATGLPHIPFGNSNDLLIGEWVIAIGNPFGSLMSDNQPTVSVGVVSAKHRRVNPRVGEGERLYQDLVQTDAAINPGNSGGPLVNAMGQVIGVNTMIFSQSGGSVGLGFAIPINRVARVAREIIDHGRRRDPWAGFKVEDIQTLRADYRGQALLQELGARAESGCLVVNILRNSPAYQASLRPGDVILNLNGQKVTGATDIDFALWDLFVGDTVNLEIDRQGRRMTIEFTIQELSR
ncbi:MAG TPA: trypsin-like peptidase domain-containing protein [Candidatus Hydrogenedentes bacterium]|nr:trypsin-like peptidase domain-containing protein [Candidatus Hydrogenedentota bacterium]